MKSSNLKILLIGVVLSAGVSFSACKSKAKDTTTDTTVTPTPEPAAPVVVNPDDSLKTGVKDATKDFPGVTADVSNGEITLTGEIERSKLPNLMQSLNSLRPKKINNNLKIK